MTRPIWLMAILASVCWAGCRQYPTAKDASISMREKEREFLFPSASKATLGAEIQSANLAKAQVLRMIPETGDLRPLTEKEARDLASLPADAVLLRLADAEQKPVVHYWNWTNRQAEAVSWEPHSPAERLVAATADSVKRYEIVMALNEGRMSRASCDADYEIFRLELECSAMGNWSLKRLQQITFNTWDDEEPALSPDGRWIVFVSSKLGTRNIALMDRKGDYLRLLTKETRASSEHPVVLPNSEEALFVREENGAREFRLIGLEGRGERKVSDDDLRDMLFSWDDRTRQSYLLTTAFRQCKSAMVFMDVPETLGLRHILAMAEWNCPQLESTRQKIRAVRAEGRHSRAANGPEFHASMVDTPTVGLAVADPTTAPGDRPVEGLTRFIGALSIPLFDGDIREAALNRDRWQELAYTQTYRREYNEKLADVIVAYYSYSEADLKTKLLKRLLDLDQKRKSIFEKQATLQYVLRDRKLLAESFVAASQADLAFAHDRADSSARRLHSLIGLRDVRDDAIQPASLSWQEVPVQVPSLQRLQVLAEVNHPDIERLKFLELRAAAIRDMGSPNLPRPRVNIAYGYGIMDWRRAMDDFIALSLQHVWPLGTEELKKSYHEQWTAEMEAFQRERENVRLQVLADVQEAYADLQSAFRQYDVNLKKRDFFREQLRVSRIYAATGKLEHQQPRDLFQPIIDEIQLLQAEVKLVELRADVYRSLTKLYQTCGLTRNLAQMLALPDSQTGVMTPRRRSLYLWQSLDVALNPARREALLRLCKKHAITRIYCFLSQVETDFYLDRYSWEFGYLLDLCKEAGIEAHALIGNPEWTDPAYTALIGRQVNSIVAFNRRRADGGAAFAGLRLAVEPYQRSDLGQERGRAPLASQYLSLVDHVKMLCAQEPSPFRFGADIPSFYFGSMPGDEKLNLAATVLKKCDELTVFAREVDPARICASVDPILRLADEASKEIEVGIETTPAETSGRSFHGRALTEVFKAIVACHSRLEPHASFRGFALQEFGSLEKMLGESNGG